MARQVRRAIGLIALALGLWLPAACGAQTVPIVREHWLWGTPPEVTERAALLVKVRTLRSQQDFAGLSALEAELRTSHASTISGASKLSIYYALLEQDFVIADPTNCETDDRYHAIDQWRAVSPKSPAPIILAAKRLQSRAWCFRDGDYANSVTSEGWRKFHDNIEAAIALLEANKTIAAIDPEYFAALATMYTDGQRSGEAFRALLDEATAADPYYYDLYYAAYRYYQPQWGGSIADVDALGRYAIDKTRARDGNSAYARYYWHIMSCGCFGDMAGIDWQMMQIAMADLARRFPTDWTYLHLVQLACQHGDGGEARKYLARLTINNSAAWTDSEWAKCSALVKGSRPPLQADGL